MLLRMFKHKRKNIILLHKLFYSMDNLYFYYLLGTYISWCHGKVDTFLMLTHHVTKHLFMFCILNVL